MGWTKSTAANRLINKCVIQDDFPVLHSHDCFTGNCPDFPCKFIQIVIHLCSRAVNNTPAGQAVEKRGKTSLYGNDSAQDLVSPNLDGGRVIKCAYLGCVTVVESGQKPRQE